MSARAGSHTLFFSALRERHICKAVMRHLESGPSPGLAPEQRDSASSHLLSPPRLRIFHGPNTTLSRSATARCKVCQGSLEIFSSAGETQKAPIAVRYCSRTSPMRLGASVQDEDRSLLTPASPLGIISPYEVSVAAVSTVVHSGDGAAPSCCTAPGV